MLKKSERIEVLKNMHRFVIEQDDEVMYSVWVTYAVPDEPTDETLESIASDINEYNDVKEFFIKLIKEWL